MQLNRFRQCLFVGQPGVYMYYVGLLIELREVRVFRPLFRCFFRLGFIIFFDQAFHELVLGAV